MTRGELMALSGKSALIIPCHTSASTQPGEGADAAIADLRSKDAFGLVTPLASFDLVHLAHYLGVV